MSTDVEKILGKKIRHVFPWKCLVGRGVIELGKYAYLDDEGEWVAWE